MLSSGAGCGKTTVLTARYAALVAEGIRPTQIATMTFTEKAAREMRGRIRSALAGNRDALRDLETAPIQTIHAFGQSLVLEFADRLGLAPKTTLLDDAAAAVLRNASIRDALETVLTTDSPVRPDAEAVVVLYGWGESVRLLERFLANPDPPAWQAFADRSDEGIADEWDRPRGDFQAEWVAYLAAADPAIAGLLTLMPRLDAKASDRRKMGQIADDFRALATSTDVAGACETLREFAKAQSFSAPKQWPHAGDQKRLLDAMTAFRRRLDTAFAAFDPADREHIVRSATIARQFTRVALSLHEAYRQAKRAQAGFDYIDQIGLARDLLRDHAEVRTALGERYRAVMVDEFQDTDPVQMEMIRHLGGGAAAPETLFVVGDEKQSIYRFRGADVGLFRELRDAVPVDGRLSLSRNYRSRPGVISFVNAAFALRLSGYEPLVATREPSPRAADVEFHWTQPDKPNARVTSTRTAEAESIARRIVELVEEGHRLGDIVLLFRAITNAAIYEAALRRHGIDYVIVGGKAFFAQQEVYDVSHLVRAIEEPRDDLAMVGVLRSPFGGASDDALTLLAKSGEPLSRLIFDVDRLSRLPPGDRAVIERFASRFAGWRAAKDRLPVRSLLQRAIAETGFDAALQFESFADRKLANLWKLLDDAGEYDRSNVGLTGYAARLGEAIGRQPREGQAATRPAEENVVRLMTMHAAKGLEFPVVIVPDIGAKEFDRPPAAVHWHRERGGVVRRPSDIDDADPEAFSTRPYEMARAIDEMAEWQEELRILYVAFTRAEERLILSTGWANPIEPAEPTAIPERGANTATMMLAERFDLGTGRCLVPGSDAKVAVRIVSPDIDPPDRRTTTAELPPWNPITPGSWVNDAPALVRWPELPAVAATIPGDGPRWTNLEWRLRHTPPHGRATTIVGAVPLVIPNVLMWRLCVPAGTAAEFGTLAAAALRPLAGGSLFVVEEYDDRGTRVATAIPPFDPTAAVECFLRQKTA